MQSLLKSRDKSALLGNLIPICAALLLPAAFNGLGFGYGITISVFIFTYIIAVSGLDILFGYSGQISLGHAAFYAIGAYGSVILSNRFNIPVGITMLISPVLAAVVGAVLAYPASRLVFHFLSLATIAFGEIVYQLSLQSPGGITGDAVGLPAKSINLFGLSLSTPSLKYYFGLAALIIFMLAKGSIIRSRVGRAFVAIRENSHAAEGMGINVRKYKIIAFAISAFYVAFAGAFYAHTWGYVSSEIALNRQSVQFITILLFGGVASKWGPVLGAISVLVLNEALRSLENLQVFVYGILLLIVILAIPGGVYGLFRDLVDKLRKKEVK